MPHLIAPPTHIHCTTLHDAYDEATIAYRLLDEADACAARGKFDDASQGREMAKRALGRAVRELHMLLSAALASIRDGTIPDHVRAMLTHDDILDLQVAQMAASSLSELQNGTDPSPPTPGA